MCGAGNCRVQFRSYDGNCDYFRDLIISKQLNSDTNYFNYWGLELVEQCSSLREVETDFHFLQNDSKIKMTLHIFLSCLNSHTLQFLHFPILQ